MKNFIAVVSVANGRITKYQDFDTQAEGDTHVVEFGGYAAATPAGVMAFWIADDVAKTLVFDQATFDADEATVPMNNWLVEMSISDGILPRWGEDLYDALNPVDQANASRATKDKVAAKKLLRSQRP